MPDSDLIETLKVLLEEIEQISARLVQLEDIDLDSADLGAATKAALEFTAKAAAVARDGASLTARLESQGCSTGRDPSRTS